MSVCYISWRGQGGLKDKCNPQNSSASLIFTSALISFKCILFKEDFMSIFSYATVKLLYINLRDSLKLSTHVSIVHSPILSCNVYLETAICRL